jgi:hypothetical protein
MSQGTKKCYGSTGRAGSYGSGLEYGRRLWGEDWDYADLAQASNG